MKAFLLAGGRGERLRPLTLSMPKCLVPVDGDPLLGIWLDLLGRHGVDDVLVNVSRHSDQVVRFLTTRSSLPRVTVIGEAEPIGNAATVRVNRSFVEGEADFWIFYSDNLTTVNLAALRTFHHGHDGVMTMGLFEAPDPRQAGIVTVAPDGCILALQEKPDRPAGTLANAGIYLARRELLDLIPDSDSIVDFATDVFPPLKARLYGSRVDGVVVDIGTPRGLARASRQWAGLKERARAAS
jgi:mannose-1-phosphate guanylyltransferase